MSIPRDTQKTTRVMIPMSDLINNSQAIKDWLVDRSLSLEWGGDTAKGIHWIEARRDQLFPSAPSWWDFMVMDAQFDCDQMPFAFTDRDIAMLFKLSFGGVA